jgi:hypothetical protein
LAGREALAELLTYADFVNSSLRGLKKLLGLYKPIKKPAISSIEKQMEEMAKKIDEEAGRRLPAYNVILEGLG